METCARPHSSSTHSVLAERRCARTFEEMSSSGALIAGSNDGVVPWRNVEEIVRVRPSVSVRRIKGRHFAIYTNPTATTEAITAFMESKKKDE